MTDQTRDQLLLALAEGVEALLARMETGEAKNAYSKLSRALYRGVKENKQAHNPIQALMDELDYVLNNDTVGWLTAAERDKYFKDAIEHILDDWSQHKESRDSAHS